MGPYIFTFLGPPRLSGKEPLHVRGSGMVWAQQRGGMRIHAMGPLAAMHGRHRSPCSCVTFVASGSARAGQGLFLADASVSESAECYLAEA